MPAKTYRPAHAHVLLYCSASCGDSRKVYTPPQGRGLALLQMYWHCSAPCAMQTTPSLSAHSHKHKRSIWQTLVGYYPCSGQPEAFALPSLYKRIYSQQKMQNQHIDHPFITSKHKTQDIHQITLQLHLLQQLLRQTELGFDAPAPMHGLAGRCQQPHRCCSTFWGW